MKNIFIFIMVALTYVKAEAQNADSSFIFDDVAISINRTFVGDSNTHDQYGFGLGIYHTFRKDKSVQIRAGIEFNQTSQSKKLVYEGEQLPFEGNLVYEKTFTNANYHLNCMSVPLSLRYNFGKSQLFYLEAGVFTDLLVNARRNAYMYSVKWSDTAFVVKNEQVKESVNMVNSIGISFGFGVNIPVREYIFSIRPEFKYALRKVNDTEVQISDVNNHYARISLGFKW